jgi:hypothetical protein
MSFDRKSGELLGLAPGTSMPDTGRVGKGGKEEREPSFRNRLSGKTVEDKRLFLFVGSLSAGYERQLLLSSTRRFSLFL